MTPEEFRRHGHKLLDWIGEYLNGEPPFPVASTCKPGEIRAGLASEPPTDPESFELLWDDFLRVVMPGITHWQSPDFFAYFPCNNSLPSILGELLSAGLGVQGMLWSTSPACTEVETHMLDWLVGWLGLPEHFRSSTPGGGVLQDSASSATLCALLAARNRATEGHDKLEGAPANLVAYCSDQAHSSIDKANMIAGIGLERLRKIPSDGEFRMQPQLLSAAIQADRQAGLVPFFVTATQGTTSSGAFDPLPELGSICSAENIWLHVDGAMMGTAACCREHRWINDGLGLADSYCFNPHKWMMVNFDCSCLYVKQRADLIGAMNVDPEYLRNAATDGGDVIDYRDWQVPLGRRFRALKLWFVLRSFGTEAISNMVRKHIALATTLEEWINEHPDFELAARRNLNLVCFRHREGDSRTQAVLEAANSTGRLFLTHTKLAGQFVIRLCVGQSRTHLENLEQAWQIIIDAARSD